MEHRTISATEQNGVCNGQLILVEGPDSVGKTSLTHRVVSDLTASGVCCERFSFPGDDKQTLGHLVYSIHHEPKRFNLLDMTEASRQALHIAAHLDAIERVVIPKLRRGVHIILDRSWWSTWVYGKVGGVREPLLTALISAELVCWGDVRPATAILMVRDTPVGDVDQIPEWYRLKREYELLAERERRTHPVFLLNVEENLDKTARRATEWIGSFLTCHDRRSEWAGRVDGECVSSIEAAGCAADGDGFV